MNNALNINTGITVAIDQTTLLMLFAVGLALIVCFFLIRHIFG